MTYLEIACRCLIGLTFVFAAVSKIIGRGAAAGFVATIRELRPLSRGTARLVAATVVAAEFAVPALLLAPATARLGFLLAVALLAAFTAGIVTVLRRRVSVRCRCFGPSGAPMAPHHVARNAVLALVAVTGLVAASAGPAPADPGALVLVAATAGVVAIVVVMLDEIVDLFRTESLSPRSR
ncbi:methylamine utilization protein MauE [Sphaerisporangium siamense]|uniref:Putative membrane protein YphA (DoxX/SURF4 family) n=1 Tax=Sphaerisporangium siamense TaxID=795645 RepID=A0A7W7GB46_9ACTN|nr:MauE/DoxX family redox-associated membrane protein [Sphaerisporangium siamense]MBB4704693.1 putative membrane protein YphA (DoxX/SURF4 family) [Sphaerisporangium siamense]GII86308.1 methylamine utilization protein MauE [Sphaerisporangium siamense]